MLKKILNITFVFILFSMGLLASPISNNPHELNVDNMGMEDACRYCHKANTTFINIIYIPDSSLICLGCHDGVLAKDRVISSPGSRPYHNEDKDDADLGENHPISIAYREGYAGLKPKNTPIQNWNGASVINDLLRDGKIECVSCHEPHKTLNERHLRHEEVGGMCASCHNQ